MLTWRKRCRLNEVQVAHCDEVESRYYPCVSSLSGAVKDWHYHPLREHSVALLVD